MHLALMGGDSSRFLSGRPGSTTCCMHAFYTQTRIFRNFLACLVFPKLVFCSVEHGLVGVCVVGAQATTNACSSCSKASLHHYINIQSCYFMQKFISPALFCFVLFVLQLSVVPQWASATTAGPFSTWDSGIRLKKLVAALPRRPSRTANADEL